MNKRGFWLVLFCFCFISNVYAYTGNKQFSNPYQISSYKITNTTNNQVWNSTSADSSMYNIEFNSTASYNLQVNVDFMSNQNDSYLDIGDGVLFQQDDTDLRYWVIPLCVNKYDFYVSMNSGICPACFNKNDDVSVLFDTANSCSFVSNDFVGPVQYLSDPNKGTRAFLIFKVKQYSVPSTLLTATANDRFTIYNNRSDTPFVYKFLNDDTNSGGLYDKNGIDILSLQTNSRDVAIIQNDNVNSPYKCDKSYNILNVNQNNSNYFANDTLTMSTSTLPLIRNLNEKNIFNSTSGSTSTNGLTITKNPDGSFTLNGTYTGTSNFFYRLADNFTLSAGTYTLSNSNENVGTNTAIFYDDAHNFDIDGSYSHNVATKTFESSVTIKPYIRVNANTSFTNFTIYPMIEKGSSYNTYISYNVYGFNNDISSYNSSSFNFIETNLNQKGKIQACIKYKDDVTNEYNVICEDFIKGSTNSRLYYNTEWFNYSECVSPFVWMCGRKMPQQVQFQLLDTANSYYFTNPLLYSQDVEWSNFFGYVSNIDVGLVTPSYAPPGITICKDKDNGVLYNYGSREVIYDSNSSEYQFNKKIIQDNQINTIFGDYELPDSFGLSGLIDIPINFVQIVRTGQCQPVSINFNIKNRNVNGVTLPCGNTFWNRSDMVNFKPFLSTFVTGYFIYQVLYTLFFWIRNKRDPVKITKDDGTEELMIL